MLSSSTTCLQETSHFSPPTRSSKPLKSHPPPPALVPGRAQGLHLHREGEVREEAREEEQPLGDVLGETREDPEDLKTGAQLLDPDRGGHVEPEPGRGPGPERGETPGRPRARARQRGYQTHEAPWASRARTALALEFNFGFQSEPGDWSDGSNPRDRNL
eukprot:CAMPEP_0197571576 /NCGR_PEP_ID=MMETSP1320-20131121/42028_1 /TAXON_ID=91990 /ORGANISM="Bolidomonas sp., Strain RCC2347" /LENGTH=159 /DNA_ID=CAMNT_0043134071 /DNA_START=1009 /DNA_END=1488 /DNA_ORIENTATION=+